MNLFECFLHEHEFEGEFSYLYNYDNYFIPIFHGWEKFSIETGREHDYDDFDNNLAASQLACIRLLAAMNYEIRKANDQLI